MNCRNYRKDRNGEYYCASTHVCYKPYCVAADLFNEAICLYHGRFMTWLQKNKLVHIL